MDFDIFLKKATDTADIVAFGETHHGTHTDIFKHLSQEMDKFNGLFLEEPVNYQSSIDAFIKTGVLDEPLEKEIAGDLK